MLSKHKALDMQELKWLFVWGAQSYKKTKIYCFSPLFSIRDCRPQNHFTFHSTNQKIQMELFAIDISQKLATTLLVWLVHPIPAHSCYSIDFFVRNYKTFELLVSFFLFLTFTNIPTNTVRNVSSLALYNFDR